MSAKELATVYHRLHQLHLIGLEDHAGGLMLALSATNAAETAAGFLEPETMADIYVGTALRIKESCSGFLQFFTR